VPPDEATREKFAELGYLEKSVGRTGLLALHPVLRTRRRDLWQLYLLGQMKLLQLPDHASAVSSTRAPFGNSLLSVSTYWMSPPESILMARRTSRPAELLGTPTGGFRTGGRRSTRGMPGRAGGVPR